jgi:hypothetical protein
VKYSRLQQAGNLARMEETRNAFRILVGKTLVEYTWNRDKEMGVKKKIKVYLREKCCKDGISTVAVLVLV